MFLLPTSYFPPISWMAHAVLRKEISVEVFEHFPKQTRRNRCTVIGKNGPLDLIVPLSGRKDKTITKDIRIDYGQAWRRIHFRSLQACYKRTPWFEFYEDDLAVFFEKKDEFLVDLNANLIAMLSGWLRIEISISFTSEYMDKIDGTDLRDLLDRKKNPPSFMIPDYNEGSLRFDMPVNDPSVLDLFFQKGKNSGEFLNSIRGLPGIS